MRFSFCLVGRIAAVAAAVLLLAPVLAQQDEAGTEVPSVEPAAQADEALPPIPDPPRFSAELAGEVGDVNGDLFWWGQTINLTGAILNNAFVGGSNANIDGLVGSDAFAFAGTASVSGEVMHNVYAFTGQMTVAESAVIHGNLICMCGTLTIRGQVRGQVLGSGGATTLSGDVGSMNLEVGSLTLTDNAVVRGDLVYRGNEDASISDDARIGGEVRFNAPEPDDDDAEEEEAGGIGFWDVASPLWWFLANLAVGVAFLLVGGKGARAPAEALREQAAVGLGFGFVVAVVIPVGCLIAFLLLVTLPLGFITLVLYFIGLFLARLVTAQYLGDWILRRVTSGPPSEYLALTAGLVVFFVATAIPYLGFLVWLTALFLGSGGIFLAVRGPRPSPLPATQVSDA